MFGLEVHDQSLQRLNEKLRVLIPIINNLVKKDPFYDWCDLFHSLQKHMQAVFEEVQSRIKQCESSVFLQNVKLEEGIFRIQEFGQKF